MQLPVALEDLYVGNEKAATVKRRVVCRNCKGKAHLPVRLDVAHPRAQRT